MKIKGRHSDYLNSLSDDPQWSEVKSIIRTRDGHKCKICGCEVNLDIHHLTYRKDGKKIVGNEIKNLECLITLCRICHTRIHKDPFHPYNPKNYKSNN